MGTRVEIIVQRHDLVVRKIVKPRGCEMMHHRQQASVCSDPATQKTEECGAIVGRDS
jgi:hypothetical protein